MSRYKKPSRAGIRVMTILAYIESSITLAGNQTTDPLLGNRIEYVRQCCQEANSRWQPAGTGIGIGAHVLIKNNQIAQELDKIWWFKIKTDMNLPGMCYIAMQLLEDLMGLITNPSRTRWLQNIHDGLSIVIARVDPKGEMYLTQERATEIIDAIYFVVGED